MAAAGAAAAGLPAAAPPAGAVAAAGVGRGRRVFLILEGRGPALLASFDVREEGDKGWLMIVLEIIGKLRYYC